MTDRIPPLDTPLYYDDPNTGKLMVRYPDGWGGVDAPREVIERAKALFKTIKVLEAELHKIIPPEELS